MAFDEVKVKEKAKQVNDTSMDYHLSHAVFACNKIIESEFKEYISKRVAKLNDQLLSAEKSNNADKIGEVLREIDLLKRPFRIYVEYFDEKNTAMARVVHLQISNQLVIYLPIALLRQSINADGSYNIDVVKKLRHLTAHELGHIALQTRELLEDEGTQGSILLSNGDTEKEANLFADELLRLRHERNKRLFESDDWKAF